MQARPVLNLFLSPMSRPSSPLTLIPTPLHYYCRGYHCHLDHEKVSRELLATRKHFLLLLPRFILMRNILTAP